MLAGYIELPLIEIQDRDMWLWFNEKLAAGHEFRINGGYLLDIDSLIDHYCNRYSVYINYTYDNDLYSFNESNDLLLELYRLLDSFYDQGYSVICIIGV